MYRRHGNKLWAVFLACDLVVTAVTWFAAYTLRFSFVPSPDGVPDFHLVVESLPGVLVLAALAYRLAGLYEVHRLKQLPREVNVACRAGLLLFVLVITLTFYRRDLYESRLALAAFLVLNTVALTLARRVIWHALKSMRHRGLNYGRAVIVGAGRTGRRVAATIAANRWTGLEAIGFVDRPQKVEPTALPRLGDLSALKHVVAEHDVDHVFIALPLARYGELPAVYATLSDMLVEVQLVPDQAKLTGLHVSTLDIDGVSFLSVRSNPQCGLALLAKRTMDIVVAGAAVVVLTPLLATLAIAVKWSSPGPVFYRQVRMGLGGRPFSMLKFRSMRVDAEKETGPVWARRGDDRCTALGRVMRRWSLDELPQLFNVLVGDMSLVGPRPERCPFVEKFSRELPTYAQRHQVKAGITGWAQVNGWRGDTSLRWRLQCDLDYITHWSLWLDVKILLLTLWCGWRHRNAY